MRRSDLILYLGILILFLGLVSWFVSKDRTAAPPAPDDAMPIDSVPDIPGSPETANEMAKDGEPGGGVLAFALNQFESLRREGDRLADRIWKDGLTDGQRSWLSNLGEQFGRLKDFTLSLQFLLILLFTALLLGLYHLVSSGVLLRMLRKSGS